MSHAPPAARAPGLDLLRAVAILWVLLYHALVLRIGEPVRPLAERGWMGVDLFFTLSGFLIGAQWLSALRRQEPGAFGRFWIRRALRILPAYAVVLAIYLGIPSLREWPDMQPAWQMVTLTANLFMDMSGPKAFSHAWSLCVEEHFYLLFPPLAWVLSRRGHRAVLAAFAAVVLGGIALRAWLWHTDVALAGDDLFRRFYEAIYYPTWCRLDGLVAGVALAVVKVHRPTWWAQIQARPLATATVGILGVGGALALFGETPTAASVTFGYPLLALGMAGWVTSAEGWRFRVPGAAGLATLAYSIYLTHKLVFAGIRDVWGGSGPVAFVVYAAATLAAGAALYVAVERPFLRLRDVAGARTGIRPGVVEERTWRGVINGRR